MSTTSTDNENSNMAAKTGNVYTKVPTANRSFSTKANLQKQSLSNCDNDGQPEIAT